MISGRINLLTGTLLLPLVQGCTNKFVKESIKPNIIIIFTDDQGYADLSCFGATGFKTPNIDNLAENGLRLTDFYVASPVSSPSRAALLTGCYPQRVSMPEVVGPKGPEWTKEKYMNGLHPDETTIADMLKDEGYATACVGKWHLGHQREHLPTKQGFDEYFGLPYSNDMWPENEQVYPALPLIEGDSIIESIEGKEQELLTKRYTERALQFINKNKEKPFFLYMAHSMPHTPIFASDDFKESSDSGLYGDVIQEIDWSVGQVVEVLKENGLFENTLIIFTSDNGPWAEFGNHAGSAAPLRGSKGTTFEGGMRVPCVISYPEFIKQGREVKHLITSLDILPTIAALTGAKLPEKMIDGISFLSILKSDTAIATRDEFYYFNGYDLQAFRSGKWKLHQEHEYRSPLPKNDGERGEQVWPRPIIETSLFDLSTDISESQNLADQYPELVKEMLQKMHQFDSLMVVERRPCSKVYE